jgi:photosystem II stability/assembly factor-like uncharacterized protein
MEGTAGGWALANGSDIQHLTEAADGTLYAYGKGLTYTLYKSTDKGMSWSYIGNVQDAITDIAVSPNDSNTVYYATTSAVYRSIDGGNSFMPLPASPGGAGASNIEITSITMTWLNNNIIGVSTRDTDNAEFGGVYTLNEGDIVPNWTDSNIGNYDVYTIAFSPGYIADRQIVAVATDETDTFTFNKIGNADWNAFIGPAKLNKDNTSPPAAIAVADGATITFPDEYTAAGGNCLFVGVDTGVGEGDVYRINCIDAPGESIATDLNCGIAYGEINTDITGLTAYFDSQTSILLAGAANSCHVYTSFDGGNTWQKSNKEPTGDSGTDILLATDFSSTGIIYAVTSGDGSGLSISRDTGFTWNQISLIDSAITSIIDFVPSPDISQSNTIFMITHGGEHSLWRSTDDGSTWERIFSSDSPNVDNLALVNLPSQYGTDCQTVFTTGESNGNAAVWESLDNGQSFQRRLNHEPGTAVAFTINAWAISDETTFFAGSFNGSLGKVYRTTNSGFTYSQGVPVGTDSLYSIVLSPDFENTGSILVGNTDGWIYYSNDSGSSFQPLPSYTTSAPLTGSVSVAFDPDFDTNHTVYAASDTADSGLYRFVIGVSNEWESIDSNLPTGATIDQLIVSDNGVLYAVSSNPDDGMERSLNPTYGSVFETVTLGLSSGARLSGLWQSNSGLWSIDNANCKLMTYSDTLTSSIVQVSPSNETPGIGSLINHTVRNIDIDWETVQGATNYEWQISYNTNFSAIPAGFNGTTSASSVHLPTLEPATTYYWRVRACAPVLSPWSAKWSFTTSMDTEGVNLQPETPTAGAEGVSIKPIFQWTVVIGAEAYELLIATDAEFAHPVIVKINDYALTTNAWQCDVSLDYETTYYWKVRAITASTTSAWSSASVFTTESEPVLEESPPTEEPEITTPLEDSLMVLSPAKNNNPLPASSADGLMPVTQSTPVPTTIINQLTDMPTWLIYLIGGLFGVVFLALVIVLVVVLKIKRY